MSNIPLAEILRPKKLSNYVGQSEIVGKNKIINKLIEVSHTPNKASSEVGFPSLIFWGPPGSGKTTLARIIANELKRDFFEISAVNASSKEVQKLVKENTNFILFIDEIHRFNKAQQDRLLPYVERGDFVLIGATTENPSFEIIGPLLSRSRVLVLKGHSEKELKQILSKAAKYLKVKLNKKAEKFLVESSNGDARVLLNVIEIASNLSTQKVLSLEDIEQALQRRQLTFDKQGEEYYNVISAFIKSMRASQTDAALYYLARMVAAGQDPLYIARRMVVFASEDVAAPTALVVANAVFRACETVGYPECQENLAAGVVYLSEAKKDRRAYDAYMSALSDVKKYGNLPVPMNIRNAPTKLMKEVSYGKGYEKYDTRSYLPDKIKGKKYYR